MKKILLFCAFTILLLTGCSSDPFQKELLTYINDDISPLADKETEALAAYDKVTGKNYTDDQTMYNALSEEVIPVYSEFISGLESVEVDTEEISKLHETYIDAAKTQSKAFVLMLDGLEKQDAGIIDEANVLLADARKGISDYKKGLDKLAEKHDVTLEK